MKRVFILFASMAVTLLISQCSQITGPEQENSSLSIEAVMQDIETHAQAIETLDEETLADSTTLPLAVERALRHLGHLIERTHAIVDTANNMAADSLLGAAETVQILAIDAAAADSLKLSFGYIRAARHLALKAIYVARGEEGPPPFIEHLWNDLDAATVLAERMWHAMEETHDRLSHRLFERGVMHLHLAKAALINRTPRRAHAHLTAAKFFLHRADERLNSNS